MALSAGVSDGGYERTTNLDFVDHLFFFVGETGEGLSFEDGFAVAVDASNQSTANQI